MKYSIQCRYSMIEELYKFVIKSPDNNEYEYNWLVEKVDKPTFLLTNANIVIKAELLDEVVSFSIIESKQKCNEKIIQTSTVPLMVFDADIDNLEIIYDYDHNPSEKEKIIGKIINKFLVIAGGGFLETQEEYHNLEADIMDVLNENIFEVKKDNKEKTTKPKKEAKPKETKIKEIKAKTAKKTTKAKKNKGE